MLMQKRDTTSFFEKNLLDFFQKFGRKNLPWRKKNITAYEVWVSEVMLQQTQVARVVEYYKKFLERFPKITDLARASWREFLPYYQGLGYYRRGDNMLKTAKIIVTMHDGKFPQTKEGLMSLPGVGEYTASAILSFARDKNNLAFDTNAQRVYGRFFYGSKNANVDRVALEKNLSDKKQKLNSAVMDFANSICLKNPKCALCPLSRRCTYFQEKGKNEIALLRQKSRFPMKDAQVFLWLHKNHKEYYSPNPDEFEVFVLDPSYNTREKIKAYFKKNYNLELSVRPPHKKIYIKGKPTIFVNAQILLGRHDFGIFSKQDLKDFIP